MATQSYLTVPHLDRRIIAKFFRQVSVDRATGCWNWTVCLDRDGYGQFRGRHLAKNTLRTHRLTYSWLVEPLPTGYRVGVPVLDHVVCENRACCNPAHLRLVLQRENLRRSTAVSSINRAKTHCPRGHAYEPLRHFPRAAPCRICRICARDRKAERKRLNILGRPVGRGELLDQ